MYVEVCSKVCRRVLYEIYKNHNVSNVCNRMINIFLNKHSRNKSNSVVSNVFQEEFCTNVYEMMMKATFATER